MTLPFPYVLLVDENDNPIGVAEKHTAHEQGQRHRAFSVFIYRHTSVGLEVLIQRRAAIKYHSGGLWSNTCCSHPQPDQEIQNEAERCLQYEMGIEAQLRKIGSFHYYAPFQNGMIENEIDHVFVGEYEGDDIPFNSDEVDEYRWVSPEIIQQELDKDLSGFTAWFPGAFKIFQEYLNTLRQERISA